jgi:hypothetical protein
MELPAATPSSWAKGDTPKGPTANAQSPSEAVEPEALVVSHLFESGEDGEAYSATVRLTGRRVGIHGARTPQNEFVQEDKVERVVPGSGPLAITSAIRRILPSLAASRRPAFRSRLDPILSQACGPLHGHLTRAP